MSYAKDLEARLRNRDAWPNFENPDFLDTLEGLAVEASQSETLNGRLAALLIYHQIIEEMTRVC